MIVTDRSAHLRIGIHRCRGYARAPAAGSRASICRARLKSSNHQVFWGNICESDSSAHRYIRAVARVSSGRMVDHAATLIACACAASAKPLMFVLLNSACSLLPLFPRNPLSDTGRAMEEFSSFLLTRAQEADHINVHYRDFLQIQDDF